MNGINRKLLVTICLLLSSSFLLFLTYSYWGLDLISDAYYERSFPFLNKILEGRDNHSLVFYTTKADRLVYGPSRA